MLRLQHAGRLAREVFWYARVNRAWWVLLLAPAVVVAMLLVGTAHVAVPYTVYTLF